MLEMSMFSVNKVFTPGTLMEGSEGVLSKLSRMTESGKAKSAKRRASHAQRRLPRFPGIATKKCLQRPSLGHFPDRTALDA